MADALGVELVEDALPGRTTVHDDAEMHGQAQNGLAHLPVALLAAQPVDWVLIMLGTNDFKARFEPSAARIAGHIMQLVQCVNEIGGGPGVWGESGAPKIGVIVPPALTAMADDPTWERAAEWRGGRAASMELATALRKIVPPDVAVMDAGQHVKGDGADPIHFGAHAHQKLGAAMAGWLRGHM